MKMIDHRAFVPASLVNKTADAIDALQWVDTAMVPLPGGVLLGYSQEKLWLYETIIAPSGTPCAGQPIGATGVVVSETLNDIPYGTINYITRLYTNGDGNFPMARLSYSSSVLAAPAIFATLSDDAVIEQAMIQMYTPSVVYSKSETILSPGNAETTSTTVPTYLGYAIFAALKNGTVEFIGSFPSGPMNKASVTDGTALIQEMWARKRDGVTVGYGVIMSLAEGGLGAPSEYLDALKLPSAVVTVDFDNDGLISCSERFLCSPQVSESLTWGSPSVQAIRLKVRYPNGDSRDVVTPRWPTLD